MRQRYARHTVRPVSAALAGASLCVGALAVAADDERLLLEEVVVTAQKRTENLQRVPISVTAITEADRDLMGARTVRDLEFVVPNLTFSGNETAGTTRIALRGIATDRRNIGFHSGIGMYVDGVYQGSIAAYNQDLIDVDTVEVLRGPQGTLFGRNTLAGAINLTTQKPNLQSAEGFLRAGYGNYEAVRLAGSVNVPLVEGRAALKIGASYVDTGGYVDNLFTGRTLGTEDENAIRAQLRIEPTEALTVDLALDAAYADRLGYNGHIAVATPGGRADVNGWQTDDPFEVFYDIDNREKRDIEGASLTLNYRFAQDYTLTSITAWRSNEVDEFVEGDRIPLPSTAVHFIDSQRAFTQEIRVVSPSDRRLNWVLGFYSFFEEDETNRLLQFLPPAFTGDRRVVSSIDSLSYAVYGHGRYQLADRFSLFGGARFTRVEKDLEFELTATDPFFVSIPPTLDRFAENNFSPEIGLEYQITPDVMAYAKYARGFKSGGFNVDFIQAVNEIDFKSEHASSAEIGVKSMLLDQRLRLNVAGFYTEYKDQQVNQFLGNELGFRVRNAAVATLYGGEMEIQALPWRALELSAGFGYVHAVYDKFENVNAAGLNYNDNRLQHAPRTTANLAATFTTSLGSFADLIARAEYLHRGDQYTNPDNSLITLLDAKNRVNARIGLSRDGQWDVFVWGKNLTDEEDVNFRFSSGTAGGVIEQVDAPRTYGVTMTYRF